jgi:hypothetical protein
MRVLGIVIRLGVLLITAGGLLPVVVIAFMLSPQTFDKQQSRDTIRSWCRGAIQWVLYEGKVPGDSAAL